MRASKLWIAGMIVVGLASGAPAVVHANGDECGPRKDSIARRIAWRVSLAENHSERERLPSGDAIDAEAPPSGRERARARD